MVLRRSYSLGLGDRHFDIGDVVLSVTVEGRGFVERTAQPGFKAQTEMFSMT